MTPEEARQLLRVQFLAGRAIRGTIARGYNIERAWRRVTGRRRRKARVWWAAAAAVIIAGLFLSIPRESDDKPAAIAPGSAKAELLLSSGEVISLAGHGEDRRWQARGVIIDNDTVAGRLRYESADANNGDASRFHELRVPRGGEYRLDLPDGTRVWLNSLSSARFPERFGEVSRDVYLRGEAYFEVAPDARLPFRVHFGEQVITVAGTRFNVSAYDDDDVWRATLVEGAIRLSGNGQEIDMAPSEQYALDRRAGVGRLERVDATLYISWVEGRFYFRAYAFEELVRKLERWYDFQMIYLDDSVKSKRFTGFVDKHAPIERALSLLEMTTNIAFQITDKTITARSLK
jgi:ferric-dicitrate binding protein FerR (iron transport regulator)